MNSFNQLIYKWFNANKRPLPWRKTKDPYKIWISEIILQQTRVVQGTEYYIRFINEFPTIHALASASEDKVLNVWQGLGYYTRARNLHSAAKFIVERLEGSFPESYEAILALKGIGAYTAAAISSIAFNLPYPAVDGNIYRLLSRYFGVTTPIDTNKGKKEIYEIAKKLIPQKNPGDHNQALMEFGALQCVPKSPDCNICLLAETCFAFLKNLQNDLPVKSKKTKQRNRYFYYCLIEDGDSILFEKRLENDIWKNLYQFPLLETKKELTDEEIMRKRLPFLPDGKINLKTVSPVKKHILSHQVIYARLLHVEQNKIKFHNEHFIQINKKDIYKFAVPRLIEEFLNEFVFKN